MAISKRMLTKWRKEALQAKNRIKGTRGKIKGPVDGGEETKLVWADRILLLTQELIDQLLVMED